MTGPIRAQPPSGPPSIKRKVTLTGARVPYANWLDPDGVTVHSVKLSLFDAQQFHAHKTKEPGPPPVPGATWLSAGYIKSVSTPDGYPAIGDCWEETYMDAATGLPKTVLHVQLGDCLSGNLECIRTIGVRDAKGEPVRDKNGNQLIEVSINVMIDHRDVLSAYNVLDPTLTTTVLKAPVASVFVKPGSL